MPTPLYPGILRAQVTFHTSSGMPRDYVVNTFHFSGAISQQTVDNIADLLKHFYNDTPGTAVPSPAHYLSPNLLFPSLRVYDLAESEPRTPWSPSEGAAFTSTWDLGVGTALPNEVAVTLSYYTDKNAPRKRGRIFLGPLNTNALAPAGQLVGDVAVKEELRGVLAGNAYTLANQLVHPNLYWCLLSPAAGGSAGAIKHGWVDNAFDTIRKRGLRSSVRTTW